MEDRSVNGKKINETRKYFLLRSHLQITCMQGYILNFFSQKYLPKYFLILFYLLYIYFSKNI